MSRCPALAPIRSLLVVDRSRLVVGGVPVSSTSRNSVKMRCVLQSRGSISEHFCLRLCRHSCKNRRCFGPADRQLLLQCFVTYIGLKTASKMSTDNHVHPRSRSIIFLLGWPMWLQTIPHRRLGFAAKLKRPPAAHEKTSCLCCDKANL